MKNIIVGIADMKVSDDPNHKLITYSLGSCLGISIYDPVAKVGGLLHIMLPDSKIDSESDRLNPCKFVNTGIPILFRSAYKLGAKKGRIRVKFAGCSQILDEKGIFNIGKRNYAAARKLLWKHNIMIEKEHCGGSFSRTMSIEISTGKVELKIAREIIEI